MMSHQIENTNKEKEVKTNQVEIVEFKRIIFK